MTEIEIKIIKFLLSAAVYSENAILKNLGIDKDTLDKSFEILVQEGYLENFEEFMKRENLNEEGDCCKSKKEKKVESACGSCVASSSCGSGSHSCSSSSDSSHSSCCDDNIFSDMTDYSKIKVLTMKAIDEFS
ncbi:MAG: hypothetical protein KGV57_04330 [Fusobacterium sp.]|nr:hypothetical protein [Fusobacterium sp.]